MKKQTLILMTLLTIGLVSCKNDKKSNDMDNSDTEMSADTTSMDSPAMSGDEMKKVTVELKSTGGSTAKGNVVFTQENGQVKMTAVLSGLKPGMHAIHIHENADCSADDGTSAGGHWNPTDEQHGKWGSADGYHRGDIGNMEADANGNATITFTTDEWCIGCDDAKMNIIGHGIIVHGGADDFTSQPSGDAGARVACGEIKE